jgi:hypothetical protein
MFGRRRKEVRDQQRQAQERALKQPERAGKGHTQINRENAMFNRPPENQLVYKALVGNNTDEEIGHLALQLTTTKRPVLYSMYLYSCILAFTGFNVFTSRFTRPCPYYVLDMGKRSLETIP